MSLAALHTTHARSMTVVVLEYLFYFFFLWFCRWTLSKTIFMFSFRRFSYSSSQEFWRVCMSHALGCLYITVSVCVCMRLSEEVCSVSVVCFDCICMFMISAKMFLCSWQKNLVYFFLSVQLNCLYYWFFCCRCNREMQCIQPTTPPTDRTRPFNTISNSNTKNRLSSSSFFLLASTNRRRRRHHQHNCTIQLFSRIFCSASSFSGINIIIFRCFWVFVNFFFFFSFLIARIKKETKLQRNNDDDDSGRNRKTIGFSLAYTLRFVCVWGYAEWVSHKITY